MAECYGKWQKTIKWGDDFKVTGKYDKRQENIYLIYEIWKWQGNMEIGQWNMKLKFGKWQGKFENKEEI